MGQSVNEEKNEAKNPANARLQTRKKWKNIRTFDIIELMIICWSRVTSTHFEFNVIELSKLNLPQR